VPIRLASIPWTTRANSRELRTPKAPQPTAPCSCCTLAIYSNWAWGLGDGLTTRVGSAHCRGRFNMPSIVSSRASVRSISSSVIGLPFGHRSEQPFLQELNSIKYWSPPRLNPRPLFPHKRTAALIAPEQGNSSHAKAARTGFRFRNLAVRWWCACV
jgi:hypothetical protein